MSTSTEKVLTMEEALAANAINWDEEEGRVTRDPHTGRIVKGGDYGSDVLNNVSFSREKVLNRRESALQSKRIYNEVEYVTIISPGNKETVIHQPATEFHKWRFPMEFEAFRLGKEQAVPGTPIEAWDILSDEQIKDLKHHNLQTIEQVARIADGVSGPLRAFVTLKLKARAWVEQHGQKANQSEMDKIKAEHAAQMAEMQRKLDQVLAMVEKQGKAKS